MKYLDFLERKNYSNEVVIPALFTAGLEKKALTLSECGHFKEIAICENCGDREFYGFSCCRDRFCPICEKKRSLLWFSKLIPLTEELIGEKFYLNMMTLTIPDEQDLKTSLKRLLGTWRNFTHQNLKMSKEFKKRFVGGIRFLEVKRGKNSKLWHPHFHLIVVKETPSRDFEWLVDAWSRSYSLFVKQKIECNVDIRPFKIKKKDDLLKSVLEVCKYVSKFDWTNENITDVQEFVDSLVNIRSVSTWGIIRKKLRDDVEDEMSTPLLDLKTLICQRCGSSSWDVIEGITSNFIGGLI